ncbi:ATP-binding protein [Aestuariivirga sp.]|uniref:ATP-binding protein n=1 Tax=Aestuariivirga sp. TaxID=2650926 RepID=UPI0039E44029
MTPPNKSAALPSFPEARPAPPPMMEPSPAERMGRIVAVTGGHAVVLLDSHEGVFANSLKGPEIGTLLKADTQHAITLALVSALSSPMPSQGGQEREMRIVEVEFIGELPKGPDGMPRTFRRGVSNYPSLGDAVYRANRSELAMAYACDTESSVRVGHIQQDPTIPAMIKVDDMLGKHFSVLGTTGTGKSCTVALILRRILEKNPQAHILLLDVHREYAQSFQGISEVITPDNMSLPFWLLNFDEAVEILIGSQPNRDADVEILRELIPQAKIRYMNNQRRDKTNTKALLDNQSIGVDTPIPFRTSDLVGVLEECIGKLDLRGELAPYKRLKAKLESISRDPRYSFMFGSLTVQDNMAQVLSRIFRVPVNGKPIAILELGGLPSEIINVVVSVLARLAFDFGVWSAGRVPITFVCEEAHRYVPNDKTLGFEPTKRAISKIAKEGRKYGVSLCIVTQRPAELDPTILSQCNTIFSLRLTNEKDQDILKAGISDAAASLLEFMPTMGTGEAITFGEGVALPTRIKFDMLPANELPRSNTASFTKNWAQDVPDDGFLQEIVHRWRAQTYNPDATGYTADPAAAQAAAAAAAAAAPAPQTAASQQLAQRLAPRAPNTGFGQAAPPPPPPPQPGQPSLRRTQPVQPAQPGGPVPTSQQNLASLLKQFRT